MAGMLERIERGEILVGDGAMGTMLLARGLEPGACPEQFGLANPEILEEIARQYALAGADLVETNTFGGTSLKLEHYGLQDQVEAINRNAVAAAKRGAQDRALVAASIGPTGKLLKPYGDTEPDQVQVAFMQQIAVLVDAGVDCLCIETMTDLSEALLAVKAVRTVSTEIPLMVTMTFDPTPRGFFTIMGTTIPQAATALVEAGADVIGSNCGNGIEQMLAIARDFRAATDAHIIIQSNAGLPRLVDGELVYDESPEFMAGKVGDLVSAGVSIIGGCCGTTPEHVAACRRAVDSLGD